MSDIDAYYSRHDTVPFEANLPTTLTSSDSVEFLLGSSTEGEPEVVGDARIESEDGSVVYRWSEGETDRVGRHYVKWKVSYGSDGTTERFPKDGFDTLYFSESYE